LANKLVIFVDGAFWHGHDWENRKDAIKSNRDFWIPKIERNRQRDREINAYYQSKGWTVLRFWDFEVKQELGTCIQQVLAAVQRFPTPDHQVPSN
jgi:DNA mismatch endonuclease (patch repair protein)